MVSRHHVFDLADDGKNTYSESNVLFRLLSVRKAMLNGAAIRFCGEISRHTRLPLRPSRSVWRVAVVGWDCEDGSVLYRELESFVLDEKRMKDGPMYPTLPRQCDHMICAGRMCLPSFPESRERSRRTGTGASI